MSRQGRVLVIDNDERWRMAPEAILTSAGFHVDTAASMSEAWSHLAQTFYHLLIVDIRMDDNDPKSREGMQLLEEFQQKGLTSAIEIIMLSAYGRPDQMRTAFRNHRVADFLAKDEFKATTFLAGVQEVFANEMRINLNLKIIWQGVSGPDTLMNNLEIDGERIKRNTPKASRVAAELDDLLCRLFYQADSIIVQPLTSGLSGAGTLIVQPFLPAGGGQRVVVKFGNFRKIEQEYQNYKTLVEPFIGGGRSTTVRDLRRTPLLGGIEYSFLGAAATKLESFRDFYKRYNMSQIRDLLSRLFHDTCGGWYANRGHLQPLNLTEEYTRMLGLGQARLEEAVTDRLSKTVQGKHELHFKNLNAEQTFTNPILAVADHTFVRPTYQCTTHGDFNADNILVDEAGAPWLIDFFQTGPSHILRDIAKLDSVIRYQLLGENEATLDERLKMEELLCSVRRFSQVGELRAKLPTENPALTKAYAAIVDLYSIAQRLRVQSQNDDDMSEYYIALLYHALNTLRFYSLSSIHREHALLSASLLASRLGL